MNCFLSAFLILMALNCLAQPTDPKFESERSSMIKMSRQLGVTCVYCHDVKNYKDGSMKTFKVAKDHESLVETLNKQYRHKISPVDCFMCHRGKAIPDFKENLEIF
jgi:hypothetical protein